MKKLLLTAIVSMAAVVHAEMMDRPGGFKVGQRMTVRPYVSLYYTFDSNVDSSHHSDTKSGSSWSVNPGFTADYKSDNWNVNAGAYYRYHAYSRNTSNMNQNSFGQDLGVTWSNTKDGGKGWSLNLRESYQYISQDDDMTNSEGRGIGRDRQQFTFSAALQRRITERWHASLDTSYYLLDYDNDSSKYAPMYGWTRWTVGGQAGYVLSHWTDFLVSANYQGYTQDNDRHIGSSNRGDSKGWTVHAGVGTHATERISYRLMAGWSHFEYSKSNQDSDGLTYSLAFNWKMSDTWHMMLLGSSYYHPSERESGCSTRSDIISWGLAHSMIRGKLNATLDMNYRHERHDYTRSVAARDYDNDIVTARVGLNYAINRFVSAFTTAEYQTYVSHDRSSYDYDRWRLTLGMRLTY